MKKNKFSIIIPHINEGYLLNITLDSIYNYLKYDDFEIIIVDDGSDDISHLEFTKNHFLKDKIKIYFEKNLGISKARNFGASKSNGEYLIFIDSHMYFNDNFLEKLNEILIKNDIDFLQPQVGSIKKKSSLGTIHKLSNTVLMSDWGETYDDFKINSCLYETPGIIGCCMIIKKNTFLKLDGFCKFFKKRGCEDLEISIRAWLNGYKCYFSPEIFVAHYFKESFTNTIVEPKEVLNNRIMFCKNCFTGSNFFKFIQAIEKNYKQDFEETLQEINNNEEYQVWNQKQKENYIYDDYWYFKKFDVYYKNL